MEYIYDLRKPDGLYFITKGTYLIIDGGYLRWKCLKYVLNTSNDEYYEEWRRKMELVRKDTKYYFGRLNQGFKVLKNPVSIRNKTKID